MLTRSHKRRGVISPSRKRSYRRRVRNSACRKLKRRTCKASDSCKWSTGKKRRFCRKAKNTRRKGRSHLKKHKGGMGRRE